MSFDAFEESAAGGRPVELYTFMRGASEFRYTSADRDVTFDSQDYTAVPIVRDRLVAVAELRQAAIKLRAPSDFVPAGWFKVNPPTEVIAVTIRTYHEGDPDAEARVVWVGSLASVSFLSGDQAELSIENVLTSMRRTGLRRNWQKNCPHVLYGPGCNVDKDDFRTDATVDALSGNTITASEFDALDDGHFYGGFVEYDLAGGIVERRYVTAHAGAVLTLNTQPAGLTVGAAVRAFPGCAHNTGPNGCARFDNQPNYGGQRFIPIKNPFGGTPIF